MGRRIILTFIVAFCLVAGASARADEKSATHVVEALHASLLEMMKNADALGFDGRSAHIAPVPSRRFTLPLPHFFWRQASSGHVFKCGALMDWNNSNVLPHLAHE